MTLEPWCNLLPGSSAQDGAVVTAQALVMKVRRRGPCHPCHDSILHHAASLCTHSSAPGTAAAAAATHRRRLRVDCSIKSHPWHATLQGEVVSEGSIWAGVPAKPLGHRAAAEYRRAIDDMWAIRPAKLEEVLSHGPSDGDAGLEMSAPNDVVLNIDTSHDVSACYPLCMASFIWVNKHALPSLQCVSEAMNGWTDQPGFVVVHKSVLLLPWRNKHLHCQFDWQVGSDGVT